MAYDPFPQGQKPMSSSRAVVISSDQTPVSVTGQIGASVIGHAPVVIVGGSIAASFTPPTNQSVSGTVGTSVIGLTPVGINVGGNPVSTNNPVPVQPPLSGFLPVTQVGSVVTVSQGSVATVIIGGSIVASFTPPANQSVSGTVNIGNYPTNQNISGSVVAVQGTDPWIVTGSIQGTFSAGNSSVQVLNFPTNQSVSGTVGASVIGLTPVSVSNFPTTQNVSGSIVATQGTTPWLISSVYGNISGSVVAFQGAGWSGSVAATITNTPTVVTDNASVITVQQGSVAVAIVSGSILTATGNSSVQVLNFPTTQNVSGSVSAWIQTTNASVITIFRAASIAGTYAEDASHSSGDRGLFMLGVRNDTVASFTGANLDYTPKALDSAGRVLIRPFAAEEARIEGYHSVVSTSQTTLVGTAGAGLRNYVTDFWLANTGATTTLVTFKDGLGSILGYTIAPAGGGSNSTNIATPIRTGANTSFDFQVQTASSIVYATVKGFKAP